MYPQYVTASSLHVHSTSRASPRVFNGFIPFATTLAQENSAPVLFSQGAVLAGL